MVNFSPSRKSSEKREKKRKRRKNAHSLFPFDFLPISNITKFKQQARIITAAGGRAIAGPGVDVLDLMPTSYHGEREGDFFLILFRFFSFSSPKKKLTSFFAATFVFLSLSLSLSLHQKQQAAAPSSWAPERTSTRPRHAWRRTRITCRRGSDI